jgi:hypothetical protein
MRNRQRLWGRTVTTPSRIQGIAVVKGRDNPCAMFLLIGVKTYLLVLFIQRLFINCPAHICPWILSNIGFMSYAFWKRWKELISVYINVLHQHFPQKNRGKPQTLPVRIFGIWAENWIRNISIRRTLPFNREVRPIFLLRSLLEAAHFTWWRVLSSGI